MRVLGRALGNGFDRCISDCESSFGTVGSSFGDEDGKGVRTKTTSPQITKREELLDKSDNC